MPWPKAARRLAAFAAVTVTAVAHEDLDHWLVSCSPDCNGFNQCAEVCAGKQMQQHACHYQADCPSTNTYCPDGAEPRPCVFSDWSEWSPPVGCTGICTRTRVISQQNSCGGAACEGPLHDSDFCDGAASCSDGPQDCELGPWGAWSACNANVTYQRERRRGVSVLPARGGSECDGALLETQDCGSTAAESTDCELSPWMEWSPCTKTCAGGQRGRLRTIERHAQNGGRHCADTLGETAPCNTGSCGSEDGPSDCALGDWSAWSSCTVAEEKHRSREIIQSASQDGKACTGSVLEVLACSQGSTPKSATNCSLSVWSEWQLCDRSCGGGQTIRSRSIAMEAAAGGALCSGALQETASCNTVDCSLYHQPCRPSAWSDWGTCSCSPGSATRTRTYSQADLGGQACDLVLSETKPCANTANEAWQQCEVQDCTISPWSEWRDCTKTCTGGMTERDRHVVQHATVGGKPCNFEQNHLLEVKSCGEGACNVESNCQDGEWGDWEGWSECTKTCRGGFRLAQRRVIQEANACGKPAEGVATKIESCNDGLICSGAVDCELTEWSDWSACHAPCTGMRERSRGIKVHPLNGGVPCGSEDKATSLSQMEHCPADPGTTCDTPDPDGCNFSTWSSWSECSVSCDGGQMSRSREVLAGADGSWYPCEGETSELAPCSTQSCGSKVDCEYGDWSEWGNCTKCGGQAFRSRTIMQQPSFGGLECEASETMQTERCARECGEPVYWCVWGNWSNFSSCTKTCGVGIHFRKRMLSMTDKEPSHPLAVASSEKDCSGEMVDIQQCPTLPQCDACTPKDCVLGDWSDWSSPLCEGICTRSRQVLTPNNECGKPCEGTLNSTKPCNADCHREDCELGEWSVWTACASALDNKYRARSVLSPGAFNGKACSLSVLNETSSCMTGPAAPMNCELSAWSGWTTCSKTCGKGQQSRTRTVAKEALQGGMACLGSLSSLQSCELQQCEEIGNLVDCVLGEWSSWQECQGSQQVRTRDVIHPADAVGEPCEGTLTETKGCGQEASLSSDCEFSVWSVWSHCPKTCGGSQSSRSRIIQSHAHGDGAQCSGTLLETQPCGQASCPDFPNTVCQYSDWSVWGPCSHTCGQGYKERTRAITAPALGGVQGCTAALTEAGSCSSAPCQDGVDCAWAEWSEWSGCVRAPSVCGIGYKRRNRSIATLPSLGGKLCDPRPLEEVLPVSGCQGQPMCCVDGTWHDWQAWGLCSATCGTGTRKRMREIKSQESFCGKPPPGSSVEYDKCSAQPCEVDVDCKFSEWSPFSECSAVCHGQQTSSRTIAKNSTGTGSPCVGALRRAVRCNPAEGEEEPLACQNEENHADGSQDCVMGHWSEWSPCSSTCEKGYSVRERTVEVPPQRGGEACPSALKEIQNCNAGVSCFEGRVDCVWEAWTEWSGCDAFDKMTRTRGYARHAANGGLECSGSFRAIKGCSSPGSGSCPVAWYNCSWSVWSDWTSCSKTCGRGGARTRSRDLQVSENPVEASMHASAQVSREVVDRPVIADDDGSNVDFKCADNLYWKDQWPADVGEYCCKNQQVCEDAQPSFLSSNAFDDLSPEDTVIRRYDLSLLKAKVDAAEAEHAKEMHIAFALGCLCLVALLSGVCTRSRSSQQALPRYDAVPQVL